MEYSLRLTEKNIEDLVTSRVPISKSLNPPAEKSFGNAPKVIIYADDMLHFGFRPRTGVEQPYCLGVYASSVENVRQILDNNTFPVYKFRIGEDKISMTVRIQIVKDESNLEHKL